MNYRLFIPDQERSIGGNTHPSKMILNRYEQEQSLQFSQNMFLMLPKKFKQNTRKLISHQFESERESERD